MLRAANDKKLWRAIIDHALNVQAMAETEKSLTNLKNKHEIKMDSSRKNYCQCAKKKNWMSWRSIIEHLG